MNANTMAATARVHTSEAFRFDVAAPLAAAFPLFGADRERAWAPDWEPVFIWPANPVDRQGMVFLVPQGDRKAVWVNTDFDPLAGYIRYVYVLPDLMTTTISLRLQERGATTEVQVLYERTSLSAAFDERVRDLARHDALAGPEWGSQIATYLANRPTH